MVLAFDVGLKLNCITMQNCANPGRKIAYVKLFSFASEVDTPAAGMAPDLDSALAMSRYTILSLSAQLVFKDDIFSRHSCIKYEKICIMLEEIFYIHKLIRGALSKLLKREGRAGAEGAILPYVSHLQLISTLKIGADYCQLCQYKLTKPNLT